MALPDSSTMKNVAATIALATIRTTRMSAPHDGFAILGDELGAILGDERFAAKTEQAAEGGHSRSDHPDYAHAIDLHSVLLPIARDSAG
jgi:hypothetical protein